MRAKKQSFFSRIIIPSSITIFALLILMHLSMYIIFENVYIEKIYQYETDILYQRTNSITFLSENINSIYTEMRINPQIMRLSYSNNLSVQDFMESHELLTTIRISNNYIHSIYIWNSSINTFYTTLPSGQEVATQEDFFDKEIIQYIDNANTYGSHVPIPRKLVMENGELEDVYTYIMYDYYSISNRIDGVIVINVPVSWLNESNQRFDTDTSMSKYIQAIDENGRVVFSTNESDYLTNQSSASYINRVFESAKQTGSFIDEVNGTKSLVTYVKNGFGKWSLVGHIPYSDIQDALKPISLMTRLITTLILILGLFIAYILSKNISSFIEKINAQLNKLKNEKQIHNNQEKHYLLQDLLGGTYKNDIETLHARIQDLSIKIQPQKSFFVILLEIDRFKAFCQMSNFDERKEKIDLLCKTIEAKMQENFICEIAVIAENQIAVLCNTEESDISIILDLINEKIKQIQKNIYEKTSLSLSAAISDIGYTYRDIPDLYRETEHLIRFRYQIGNQAIINNGILSEPHVIQLAHTRDLKDSIITALLGMKREKVQELFTDFSTALSTGETLEIKMMLVDLITSLKTALDKKELIIAEDTWDLDVFVDELLQEESLADALHSIQYYLNSIMDTLDEQQKLKYEALTQQIKEFIKQHYSEEFFSINNVADYTNLSTNYVGRIFKKYQSVSIADYIIEVRLSNAVRLLSESDYSVNEISRQIGFTNNSYFYNLFKKTYGMTPNQYRQQI